MILEHIRKTYGVPAKRGQKVCALFKTGAWMKGRLEESEAEYGTQGGGE